MNSSIEGVSLYPGLINFCFIDSLRDSMGVVVEVDAVGKSNNELTDVVELVLKISSWCESPSSVSLA